MCGSRSERSIRNSEWDPEGFHRVVKKESSYLYLKSYSMTMLSSKFVGTLLAQVIFIPAAYYIAWFAKWI
ncbi:DUF2837 family protein [Bacillus sp. BHET2]|nr:DUF2837 family protein [Bacillus sp. BHET2]